MRALLTEAREEILSLRRRNEVLEGQVMVVQAFRDALAAQSPEKGYGVDVAWSLSKKIAEFEEAERQPQPAVEVEDGA